MNLELSNSFQYVYCYETSNDIASISSDSELISKSRKVIQSPQINHELLSMMFARNFNNTVITLDQMAYGVLSEDELTLVAQVGSLQLTEDPFTDKIYEFKSLLDTINVTVLDIDRSYNLLALHNGTLDSIINVPLSSFSSNAKKLLLFTQSSHVVRNLSQEIHNRMLDPHHMFDDLILMERDITNLQSMALVDDNYFDMQSLTKLGELLGTYENTGDTEYAKGIYDVEGRRYIYEINSIPSIVN